jgi:hypothetical protein
MTTLRDSKGIFFRPLLLVVSFTFGTWIIWDNTLSNPQVLQWNQWAFYEWLINYEGGFVRRGLVGASIVRFFYGNEVVVLNWFVFILTISLFGLTNFFIFKKIRTLKPTVIYIFSPVGFYWIAVGNEYYYRKEILFLMAIVLVSLLFDKARRSQSEIVRRSCFLTILIADMILPFVHEAFLFFNGLFFYLILLNLTEKEPLVRRVIVSLHIALCLLIFVVLSFFKGDSSVSLAIWQSLSSAATSISGEIQPVGGISAIGWSLLTGAKPAVAAMLSGLGTYYLYGIAVVYLSIGYIAAEQRGAELLEFYKSKEFIRTFGTVWFTFLPLFVLGWDWGRWIFGIAYVSLFVLMLKIEGPIVQYWDKLDLSRIGRFQFPLFAFSAILLLELFTRIPECCFMATGSSWISSPFLLLIRRLLGVVP